MLNNISGVKYHFVVRVQYVTYITKLKTNRILLNILNYTLWESLFHEKKGGGAVFERLKGAFFQKKKVYPY